MIALKEKATNKNALLLRFPANRTKKGKIATPVSLLPPKKPILAFPQPPAAPNLRLRVQTPRFIYRVIKISIFKSAVGDEE
ncbi:MAG: hypothetical protein EAZ90_27740 [Oscillatoriales cyanobacterium]|nr:MAG: hypothetical protein EAZ94_17480 [Oscillatoriales cyanobacterium]TAE22468.1 MAG: hypothetical protein EAZ93_18225 [Oscillatoriales cyanobacterium]TAE36811.1 MAG: hypothetical protein EAZ90_27740 [Oscillatoriales cyanobacterium]TAE52550.1 MAG: hypothetical protein EAZ88_14795 [Oscillatoriales cyanobacterium]TAE69953.1 MAG: hypothetical protein EAZ86_08115 [Oscillatoriales cyanobacterium]